jgi:isopenicillin-N N-acyltransferase-like protein
VANTVRVYERLLGELAGLDRTGLCTAGDRVADVIASRWPELVRELDGIAAGAGQPAGLVAAINARTELMPSTAAAAECSLIAEAGPRGGRLAQNWDWHPDLRESIVIWSVVQPGGRWFATLTEAGMLAKLGMTSTGLCCGLNFLRSSIDHGAGGVPIHVALRLVLERCDRGADAVALLRSLEMSASSCITVAAEDGVAAVELSPAGRGVVEPDGRGHLVHANHFVGALPFGSDLEIADGPGSQLRQAHLEAALARDGYDPGLLQAHNDGPEPVCRHDDPAVPWPDRIATLATVALDPSRGRFDVALGPPCATPLEAVELP